MTVREALRTSGRLNWLPAAAAAILILSGCGGAKPAGVRPPSVDADAAGDYALENYDANKDGAIDKGELAAKCPPLAAAMPSYDADSNGQLSREEVVARVTRLYGSGNALLTVDCMVTLDGRPLTGATVRFRPVAMFGDELQPAEGVTDEQGAARPSVTDENLPEDLKGTALMAPGLYHVEITHPQRELPARYNTATELGFEVDPVSRTGTAARFDLTSK